MSGLNLEDLKKHIQEGSKAVLASINPFGALYQEIEHMKTFLSTMSLNEYSVLTISVVISVVLIKMNNGLRTSQPQTKKTIKRTHLTYNMRLKLLNIQH